MVARRKFDKAQQEGGKAAQCWGCAFITEGALFRLRRATDACTAVLYRWRRVDREDWPTMAVGANLMAPHGGLLFVLLIGHEPRRYWDTCWQL